MLETIEGAVAVALKAHDGQVDKKGVPYILHPLRVGASLHEFGDEYVIAGMLHDVVEDTPMTIADLEALGASASVVTALALLTKTDEHEPYLKYVERAATHDIAGWVKTADIVDNMSRLDGLDLDTAYRLESKYRAALDLLAAEGFDARQFTERS